MVVTETVCQKTNGTEIYEVSIVLAPPAETMSDTNGKKIGLVPTTSIYCILPKTSECSIFITQNY